MKALRSVVVCAALAVPALAQAQAAGDRPAETYEEIERGVYFSVLGGPLFIVNPPASDGGLRPFSPGQMAEVEVGVDLGERLSLGLFVRGAVNRAGSEYTGNSGGTAAGDFSTLVTGAVARLRLTSFPDVQDVPRTWIYARVGRGTPCSGRKRSCQTPTFWYSLDREWSTTRGSGTSRLVSR